MLVAGNKRQVEGRTGRGPLPLPRLVTNIVVGVALSQPQRREVGQPVQEGEMRASVVEVAMTQNMLPPPRLRPPPALRTPVGSAPFRTCYSVGTRC